MLVLIGMAARLLFKPNKVVSIVYGLLLFLSFLIYLAAGAGLFYAASETRTYFDSECRNSSSDLNKADQLYKVSNTNLCSAACPCDADRSKWFGMG